MVTISHDAFTRTSIVRTIDREHAGVTCKNCGSVRYRKGEPIFGLYRYATVPDDSNHPNYHTGLFCSKSCHDAYHS